MAPQAPDARTWLQAQLQRLLPHHLHQHGQQQEEEGEGEADGALGKESAYNAGDLDLILELGRSSGGGYGKPLQYSCLENPHEQKSLAGYIPWGLKELD